MGMGRIRPYRMVACSTKVRKWPCRLNILPAAGLHTRSWEALMTTPACLSVTSQRAHLNRECHTLRLWVGGMRTIDCVLDQKECVRARTQERERERESATRKVTGNSRDMLLPTYLPQLLLREDNEQ